MPGKILVLVKPYITIYIGKQIKKYKPRYKSCQKGRQDLFQKSEIFSQDIQNLKITRNLPTLLWSKEAISSMYEKDLDKAFLYPLRTCAS